MSHYKKSSSRSRSKSKSKTQKRQQSRKNRISRRRQQRGGNSIISPAIYSNQNNARFSQIGFTDPTGVVSGCTGSTTSAASLMGKDIFTKIGGINTPVTATMKGGRRRGRGRMQRGGVQNTNGYSVGGVHLNPSLSGIATNYHTPYDSCKG